MEALLQGLQNLKIKQKIRDDDSVDQLHHYVSVALLALGGFLVGLKEFAGEPLDCWVELNNWKHFQGHVNSYCWASKIYKFPNPSNLSETPYPIKAGLGGPDSYYSGMDLGEINFYRGITALFFIQAFLFKLPSLIWTACNDYSGTQIEKMVTMVSDLTFEAKVDRDTMFGAVAEFLEIWLTIKRTPYHFMKSKVGRSATKVLRRCMLCVGNNKGNFLSSSYLVVKFLFLFNVLVQFFILTFFLEFNFWHYGPEALGSKDDPSRHFPQVGLCHFQMKETGNWVQCILTINMLLEKIFIIEWFWLLFLFIITVCSFLTWCCRIFITQLSISFVKRYLRVINRDGTIPHETGVKTCSTFVMNYLGNDGVFVLRILAANTNDVAMAELISSIWDRYLMFEKKTMDNMPTTKRTEVRNRCEEKRKLSEEDVEMKSMAEEADIET